MANVKDNRMQVMAVKTGHYGVIREPGGAPFFVEFKDQKGNDITAEAVAKSTWLEPYDPDKQAALEKEVAAEKKGERSAA